MSAVLQENHLESIYDHDVTENELDQLFGGVDERLSKEEYIELRSHDSAYADLYSLYSLRHNTEIAQDYLNNIVDTSYRRCVAQPFCVH